MNIPVLSVLPQAKGKMVSICIGLVSGSEGGGGFSRQVRGWGVAGQNCIGQTVEGTDRVRYSKQILCFLSSKM